jgi:hypothetical protein
VRWMIALRSDLPRDVIERLAEDEDEWVRAAVAKRKDLRSDLAERLAGDGDDTSLM